MNDPKKPYPYEFGGPKGCFFIMLYSHILPYFFWMSLELKQGGLLIPSGLSISDFSEYFSNIAQTFSEKAVPDFNSTAFYLGFLLFQVICTLVLPGVWIKGLPVPTEGNKQHDYLCNGASSWYVTLVLVFVLEKYEVFTLSFMALNFGRLLTVSIIFSDILSLIIYLAAEIQGVSIRMSGYFFYDFFMGAYLNPRIGYFDFKMWAEIRVSWILLFLLTLSAAILQYKTLGFLSYSMIIIVTAQFLYTNACMKGEECIPTTWDIFYEKWGWMLVYWNLAGVPFVYCFQAFYILKNNPELPEWWFGLIMITLFIAYYIWDTAQSQKNRFRMKIKGTYVKRYTIPQLPWGTLENPKFMKTEAGDPILIDGWWQYARKIHYTADITMATIWGLSCGFGGILPYYYPIFFTLMIRHRSYRDFDRCSKKYKKDWEEYCRKVPYVWIPGII